MVDANSERNPRGNGRGQSISGRTTDFLYTILAAFIFADTLSLVLSGVSGNLPYPVIIIQAIILPPLIFAFYYVRRGRGKPVGRDFNI